MVSVAAVLLPALLPVPTPFFIAYAAPVLSDEDTYDVAGFINSTEQPRTSVGRNRFVAPLGDAAGPERSARLTAQ